jgi:hypothetical protein
MADSNMEITMSHMKGSLLVCLALNELTQTCCGIHIATDNLDRHHFRPTPQGRGK